jgi:hypothetical protein
MRTRQQTIRGPLVRRASARQRKIAAVIVSTVTLVFAGLWVLQRVGFDFGWVFPPCGFKQRTGLPCPSCGMTTATLAFARGDVVQAYLIQPAAAFFCTLLAAGAVLAFLVSVFGVYFSVFDRLAAEVKVWHVIVAVLVVVLAGWAVTMAHVLASPH